MLVNSASYRVNLDAMRACLEAGCHYIDLGGLYHLTGEQLALHGEFERAGLLALLGMGSSPGKTNVMAARAVRELGATPERVDVLGRGPRPRPARRAELPVRAAHPGRRADDGADGARAAAGRQSSSRSQDGGEFDFPEPIGRAETIYTLHSEVRTFPESFGCTECSFRLSLAPAVLERVREPHPGRRRRDREGRGRGGALVGQDRVRPRGRGRGRRADRRRDRRDQADARLGARRGHRVHGRPGGRRRAPARAGRASRSAARCRPSAASSPTTCSRAGAPQLHLRIEPMR